MTPKDAARKLIDYMSPAEIRKLLDTDPDFIMLPRFDFSLRKVQEAYPNGCPPKMVAAAMQMKPDEIELEYQALLVRMRQEMGIRDDELDDRDVELTSSQLDL